MYEGDTPNAERRAAALALDRELLRELLGQEELRELIDPGALEQVEADLQRTSERTRADSVDALHDVLRRVGDLTLEEARERVARAGDAEAWLEQLAGERRAIRLRLNGEPRWAAAEDAGLLPRRARRRPAVRPAGGLHRRRARRDGAAGAPLGARPRPVRDARAARALRRSTSRRCWPALERAGELVRGELRPGGTQREWCDPEVLRRLRRASLAALRKEIEPADQRALARFMPSWQGVDRHPPTGAGIDRLRDVLVPLQGLRAARRRVGEGRAAAPHRRLLAGLARPAVRGRRGRVDRRRARSAAAPGSVALYFREDVALLGPPPAAATPPPSPRTRRSASGCAAARASSPTCWSTSPASPPRSCRRRCGTSCGRAR